VSQAKLPANSYYYEAFTSPVEGFSRALSEAGLGDRVHNLSHGDIYGFEVPAARGGA
jgi:hypothetical protein